MLILGLIQVLILRISLSISVNISVNVSITDGLSVSISVSITIRIEIFRSRANVRTFWKTSSVWVCTRICVRAVRGQFCNR